MAYNLKEKDAFAQEVVGKLSKKSEAAMCKDGSKTLSLETLSSSKVLWVEMLREFSAFDFEEGQNNLLLGNSIVHKLTLEDLKFVELKINKIILKAPFLLARKKGVLFNSEIVRETVKSSVQSTEKWGKHCKGRSSVLATSG